jgi:hypothetical protein
MTAPTVATAVDSRAAAQAKLRLLFDLTEPSHEQIGELERIARLTADAVECFRCGVENPRDKWEQAGNCPFCHKTTL